MSVGQKLKIKTAQNDALQAEVALMRAEHRLKMATENAEIASLNARLAQLTAALPGVQTALDKARNGLEWYGAENPGQASPADDEMFEEIDAALSTLRALLPTTPPTEGKE